MTTHKMTDAEMAALPPKDPWWALPFLIPATILFGPHQKTGEVVADDSAMGRKHPEREAAG